MKALNMVADQLVEVKRARAQEEVPELMRAGAGLREEAARSGSLGPEDRKRLQASLRDFFEDVDKLAELTNPGDDLIALQQDLRGAAKSLAAAANGGKKRRQPSDQGADSKEDGETSYTSRDLSSFPKIIADAVNSGKKSRNKMHMPKWPTLMTLIATFLNFTSRSKLT